MSDELFYQEENPKFKTNSKLLIAGCSAACICGLGFLIYLCVFGQTSEIINQKIVAMQSACEVKP